MSHSGEFLAERKLTADEMRLVIFIIYDLLSNAVADAHAHLIFELADVLPSDFGLSPLVLLRGRQDTDALEVLEKAQYEYERTVG